MRKTTRKVAFLLTPGFLGFDFNIFYCNTFCLVYLPVQHCRKPISGNPDFSIQKQGFLDGFLAIVHHLVELHGGTVAVQSRGEGQGTTFAVTLPCCASQSESAEPAQ